MTIVKICGITNERDAHAAVEAGADMLGFIFCESPRRVAPDAASKIIGTLPAHVKSVGVFTQESVEVQEIVDQCSVDFIQLHGGQSEEFAEKFGAERVIRALRVRDEESIGKLSDYGCASFYLLDAYVPGRAGGTGHAFDWELAMGAEKYGLPVILAGGLNPQNAADAVRRVRPFGIDVSSGVELAPGVKDHSKIKELIENVRSVELTA